MNKEMQKLKFEDVLFEVDDAVINLRVKNQDNIGNDRLVIFYCEMELNIKEQYGQ